MKFIALTFIVVLLTSCKIDPKKTELPEFTESTAVKIDGMKTDAVDTLLSRPKVLDSLQIINEKVHNREK